MNKQRIVPSDSVMLFPEGVETCEGDPCKTPAELANADVTVRAKLVDSKMLGLTAD